MKPTLLFCALVFLCATASAQKKKSENKTPDYVINNKGDTIRCIVKKPFLGTPEYDTPDGAIGLLEDFSDIKEYYMAKKDLLRRRVVVTHNTIINKKILSGGVLTPDYSRLPKNDTSYMDVVVNGKISLYETSYTQNNRMGMGTFNYTSSKITVWYVGKDSDNVKELKSGGIENDGSRKEREDMLADMFKDNQLVYNLFITQKKFTYDSLRDIVTAYNTGKMLTNTKPAKKADDTY